jgi:NAD(P)-dependent dehydrogenase (short-subunit alcohol dehydrogenase family)
MTDVRVSLLAAFLVALPACAGEASDGRRSDAAADTATDAAAEHATAASDAPAASHGAPKDARVVLVTGSTDGLGREVARRLGADGAHVIVHGRDVERGEGLVEEIEASGAGSARFFRADFAHLDSVRALADSVRRSYDRLDVLVNNAGILVSPDERPVSADGHELHFQVNYLAGFLLTRELLPLLRASAPARVVNVSSRSSEPLDFGDLMLEEGYSAGRAYGQSKLAQVMFTFELAEELAGTGVRVNALHPASLMDTDLVRDMGMEPRSSVDEGADAVLHLIDDEVGTGQFYRGTSRARAPHPQAYDASVRARLMEVSRELTGLAEREGRGAGRGDGTGGAELRRVDAS